jgi:hypothetical protein
MTKHVPKHTHYQPPFPLRSTTLLANENGNTVCMPATCSPGDGRPNDRLPETERERETYYPSGLPTPRSSHQLYSTVTRATAYRLKEVIITSHDDLGRLERRALSMFWERIQPPYSKTAIMWSEYLYSATLWTGREDTFTKIYDNNSHYTCTTKINIKSKTKKSHPRLKPSSNSKLLNNIAAAINRLTTQVITSIDIYISLIGMR